MTHSDLDQELNEMAENELKKDTPPPPPPPPAFAAAPSTPALFRTDDQNLAVITHVATIAAAVFSGGLLHVIVPAVGYFAFQDKSDFLKEHARNQLNFQITSLAVLAAAVVLSVVTLGIGVVVAIPALLFFFLLDVVCSIRAALAASRGESYAFPLSLQLIK